jgi:ketosteroid isomerase-like protein
MNMPHPRSSAHASLVSLPLMFSLISARAKGASTDGDVEQIGKLFGAFDNALRRGDVDALLGLMAPDVIVLTSGLNALRGTPALRPLLEQFLASGPDFLPETPSPAPLISPAGDMAFLVASYQMTLSLAVIGERILDEGRHAFVLQKHGGAWRIALLAGPSSPWFGELSGTQLVSAPVPNKRVSAG